MAHLHEHLNYQEFSSFFGDLGITEWAKFNYIANYVPEGWAEANIGAMEWSHEFEERFNHTIQNAYDVGPERNVAYIYCQKYQPNVSGSNNTMFQSRKAFIIYDNAYDNVDSFKAANTNEYFIYKKA